MTCKHKFIVGDIHYTADDYHMYINHKNAVYEYLKNVAEDKEYVVSGNYSKCVIDNIIFDGEEINNIDDFLNVIDKHLSSKHIRIVQTGYQTDFEYNTIKADIAI